MPTALLLTALCLAAEAPATQAAPSAEDKDRQEEVSRLAPAKARLLTLLVGNDEQPATASLHAEPLLRWSNPTAGSVYGEVYLWHDEGRPAAVASIFRWYHPFKDGTVEIVSLSPSPVEAREADKVQWECREAGVSYNLMKDMKAPATNRTGRLLQMRDLARRFTAELQDSRSGERVTRELRLLNHPLHRYESPRHKIADGALFAFAEVTDPEVIVMIEAVAGEAGEPGLAWRYALARMNNHELDVQLDGRAVKSWPRIDSPWKDRKSSYTLFGFDPSTVNVEIKPERP
jgi:hypothetical protein